MCITMAIAAGAALLGSAASTASTIMGNKSNAAWAKYQAAEQTKQIREDTELARIASMEKENERAREFGRSWSASMAAIGASGLAEHISFFQGVAPDNLDQFNQDMRAARLNLVTDETRSGRQIGVVKYGAQVERFNSKLSSVAAIGQFMQDAGQAYNFYSSYKTPAKAGG